MASFSGNFFSVVPYVFSPWLFAALPDSLRGGLAVLCLPRRYLGPLRGLLGLF